MSVAGLFGMLMQLKNWFTRGFRDKNAYSVFCLTSKNVLSYQLKFL